MALSQKHSGKILVPWYNSHEWRYVYSLIYSESSTKSDKQRALTILQIWKIRMPILFAGLEGTLTILSAMLYDENDFTKEQLAMFYALAIMRFLNLCAAQGDQQGTLFHIAKERNLPEWLVNIRHDLSHSQKQSSLFMLRKGIEYCFEWLKREYWELQDREINDFIIPDVIENVEEQINLYFEYVNNSIAQEELSLHVVDMLKELNVYKNLNLNILKDQFKGNKLAIENIIDLVVTDGNLFATAIDEAELIPTSYIKGWEPLIQYLQENNALIKLIKKLHYVGINNKDCAVQRISSLWLREIFEALVQSKKSKYTFTSEISESNTYIMNLHEPSEKLLFELKKFADEVLHCPHLHFRNYLTSLMTVCAYTPNVIQDIDYLMFEYINPHTKLTPGYIPITIEYAKTVIEVGKLNSIPDETESTPKRRWQKLEDTSAYEDCPIGILPDQNRSLNPTISF